jgi:small-conductance mechanosensitive channel
VSLIVPLAIVVGVLLLTLVGHGASYLLLRRSAAGHGRTVVDSLIRNTHRPNQFLLPLAAAEIAASIVPLPALLRSTILHAAGIALVLAVAWLLIRLVDVLEDALLARYQMDVADNLRARQIHTQVDVLRRVTIVMVAVLAVGSVLLSFDQVRAAGAGVLASAGVVGIIAGIAVTPMASNVVAGLQIAITQPIRVDDVVVVAGDWGRIEEIHLTFVVVRVWDLRRLIVPISYFTHNPFENWTRVTADIMGWVYIEVDYTAPIEALRRHLGEVVAASPDFDGKFWNLQVTNLGRETVQLRALVTSADSSKSWNLQCEVREKMLGFLQENYPQALPRVRTEVGWAAGDGNGQAPSEPRARGPAKAAGRSQGEGGRV